MSAKALRFMHIPLGVFDGKYYIGGLRLQDHLRSLGCWKVFFAEPSSTEFPGSLVPTLRGTWGFYFDVLPAIKYIDFPKKLGTRLVPRHEKPNPAFGDLTLSVLWGIGVIGGVWHGFETMTHTLSLPNVGSIFGKRKSSSFKP